MRSLCRRGCFFARMEIPKDVKIYETSSSTFWFDELGIMYSVSKPDAPPITIERSKADFQTLRNIIGDKKICIITESSSRNQIPGKAERDFIAEEITKLVIAWAIITRTPLSKMMANLFFAFKPPPYPMKMFTDFDEAKQWLMKHCNSNE